jgi:hypothetical protein
MQKLPESSKSSSQDLRTRNLNYVTYRIIDRRIDIKPIGYNKSFLEAETQNHTTHNLMLNDTPKTFILILDSLAFAKMSYLSSTYLLQVFKTLKKNHS